MKWGKVKVGDCCEVTSSKRIFFSEYVDSGVPFYRSKEIIESSNGQAISEPLFISQEKYDEIKNHFGVPQSGDMLLTSVGTIGVPYIVREKDYFYFKDGSFSVTSDFDRNKTLYRIPLNAWIAYMDYVASDDIVSMSSHYEQKADDYIYSRKERGKR